MKFKRIYLLISFALLIVISTNAIEVNAMNTKFSTEELSEETKTTFVSNINVSPLSAEPEKKGVLCFDVNEQGMIAVGQNDSQCKEICVYTSQGEFLYGYTFNCNQSFCVEWDEQHINIYFIRSDVIISLDSDGNILDIKGVQDTIDNNSYRNSLLYSTTRTVGNTTYLIRNDMGIFNWIASSFSQIVTEEKMNQDYCPGVTVSKFVDKCMSIKGKHRETLLDVVEALELCSEGQESGPLHTGGAPGLPGITPSLTLLS